MLDLQLKAIHSSRAKPAHQSDKGSGWLWETGSSIYIPPVPWELVEVSGKSSGKWRTENPPAVSSAWDVSKVIAANTNCISLGTEGNTVHYADLISHFKGPFSWPLSANICNASHIITLSCCLTFRNHRESGPVLSSLLLSPVPTADSSSAVMWISPPGLDLSTRLLVRFWTCFWTLLS